MKLSFSHLNLSASYLSVVLVIAAFSQPASVLADESVKGKPDIIHLEAENAKPFGTQVATGRTGYSGTGYVTGFEQKDAKIEFTIPDARAGIYELQLRYSSPTGEKGYDLSVNGSKISGMLAKTGPGFSISTGGKIELKSGLNTLVLERGWGYYDIDAIDLIPATIGLKLQKPPKNLVDKKAISQARALHDYLVDLYGQKTLSGQHEAGQFPYIENTTGKTPAILGGDLIEYSPTRVAFGAKPEGTTEQLIKSARNGQILTLMWHWNAPAGLINQENYVNKDGKTVNAIWWRGFYTEASTFDLAQTLANPQSEDYKKLISDIDVLAIQLKKVSDAGIPVLWRPLHEAEGGWFWWGAKGPKPFVQLWRLMFDRLTNIHQLHNLIWVYTGTANMDWYPGDNYVDIVGVDAYPTDPSDPLSSNWDALKKQFDGKKLLALSEFGGVPDIGNMRRYGVSWSYFMSWSGDQGAHKISKSSLTRIYQEKAVVNKSDLKPLAIPTQTNSQQQKHN